MHKYEPHQKVLDCTFIINSKVIIYIISVNISLVEVLYVTIQVSSALLDV